MTRVMTTVLAEAYVADGYVGNEEYPNADYWIEGDPVRLEVEADENVRIGVMVPQTDQEVAGLYLSPSSARDLVIGLGAAIRDLEN